MLQLTQAQTGKFNVHVNVEYEWRLQNEDLDESDEEMEDKVSEVLLPRDQQEAPGGVTAWFPPAAHPQPPRRASRQLLRAGRRPAAAQPGGAGPRRRQPGAGQAEASGHQHADEQRDLRLRVGLQPAATRTDAAAATQGSQQRSEVKTFSVCLLQMMSEQNYGEVLMNVGGFNHQ